VLITRVTFATFAAMRRASSRVSRLAADHRHGSSPRDELFDHLVGAQEGRCRHVDAKRFGSLAIEQELEL
jgi:hypothetical protein